MPSWHFDPKKKQFKDASTGKAIPARKMVRLRDAFVESQKSGVQVLAAKLAAGDLSLQDWHANLKGQIKATHTALFLLGKGGKNNFTAKDGGKLGATLKGQYQYLQKFAAKVAAGELSAAQVANQSTLYIDSATASYEKAKAAAWDITLPEHPADGNQTCRARCKCHWVITETSEAIEARWVLDPAAEHCSKCEANAANWNPLVFPKPKPQEQPQPSVAPASPDDDENILLTIPPDFGTAPAAPPPPPQQPEALDPDLLKKLDLHQAEPTWDLPPGTPWQRLSYGGVLFDDQGRVLLREPKDHYDGYAWTFPKGKKDAADEHPVDTALREVEQETGHAGEILGLVPGGFQGGSGRTYFFLMKSGGYDASKMDGETESTKWLTIDEAREHIQQTTNKAGQERDLKVLEAASQAYANLQANPHANDHLKLLAAAQPSPPQPAEPPRPPVPTPAPEPEKPRPPTKPAKGFPEDLDGLEVVKALGGSTGAELVRDPETGRQFVRKRGSSPDHLREECTADAAYQALGVKVPGFHLYETAGGPVKLAEFVEGRSLAEVETADPKLYRKAVKALQKDFAADALLGNWDVIGQSADNILVDAKGVPYRIDNGGSLRFRAQGAKKTPEGWNQYPKELWSLRDGTINPQTARVFGDASWVQIIGRAEQIEGKKADLLKALPADLRPVVEGRLKNLKDVVDSSYTLIGDKFKPAYADGYSKHLVGIRAAGISDKLPREFRQRYGPQDVTPVDENGKEFDELRGQNSRVADLKKYIDTNGGSYDIISRWMEQQARDSWESAPKALKHFLVAQRGGKVDDYWWKTSPADCKQRYEREVQKAGGEERYAASFQALHAFTQEILGRTKFPNKDDSRKTVRLIRTEDLKVMRLNGLASGAKGVTIKRGACESTSVFREVTAHGTEVTSQKVPYHRILATYFQERTPNSIGGAFLGDSENEFLAMLDDVKFDYR